jgi:hypothetical protein
MVPMVGLERLEHPRGRGRNARVVQVRAMLVNRKELTDFVPHDHPAGRKLVAAGSENVSIASRAGQEHKIPDSTEHREPNNRSSYPGPRQGAFIREELK